MHYSALLLVFSNKTPYLAKSKKSFPEITSCVGLDVIFQFLFVFCGNKIKVVDGATRPKVTVKYTNTSLMDCLI